VFAVLFGLADGFFYPAAGGIVPLVVESHELASANTLIGVSRQASFVVGPALAGTIYGLAGSSVVFGFDAATFLVSAGFLLATRPRSFEAEPSEGTLHAIAEGIRYVAGVPWLWVGIAVTSAVLMVAMAPFQALAPAFVADQFGEGVGAYGLLFAFEALGMTIGMIAFGQLNPRRRRIWQIFGFLALNDLFAVLMTLQHSYEVAAALMVVRGTLIGYAIGLWSTLMMEWVPEGKLARVTSLDFFGAIGLVPLGYALTALVSQAVEPATILGVGFALAGILWATPLLVRRVRDAA
jgi:MFS family permease